jgi:hypothetical protein
MASGPFDAEVKAGCATCIPERPVPAASLGLQLIEQLVDESHLIVSIRACATCAQRFVWVFTEIIDWSGGDDQQRRAVMPIGRTEADALIAAGEHLDLTKLSAMGRTRRFLFESGSLHSYMTGELIGRYD